MEAKEWCESSGVKTASAEISDEACYFYGIVITTDATNDATVSFYDSEDNSGTKLLPDMVFASATDLRDHKILLPYPIAFSTGLYIGLSVAGQGSASYVALYRKRR